MLFYENLSFKTHLRPEKVKWNSLLSNWVFRLINKHPWQLLHPHTRFLNIFRFLVHLGGQQWVPHNNTSLIKIFQKKIFNFGTRDLVQLTGRLIVCTLRALVVTSRNDFLYPGPLVHSFTPPYVTVTQWLHDALHCGAEQGMYTTFSVPCIFLKTLYTVV